MYCRWKANHSADCYPTNGPLPIPIRSFSTVNSRTARPTNGKTKTEWPVVSPPTGSFNERAAINKAGPKGPALETITDELVLPNHRDEDRTIVHLTKTSFQRQGLREGRIRLGKMMTGPKPFKWLEVLDDLPARRDIDPTILLRKMSKNSSPSVRTAAVRAILFERNGEKGKTVIKKERNASESVMNSATFYEKSGNNRLLFC